MENYIVINGRKAELTKEQLEKLGIKVEKTKYEKMFERKYNEDYYIIDGKGNSCKFHEFHEIGDDQYFNVGNYCSDGAIMKQRALHEILNRLLWRAGIIAGELDNPWCNNNYHYFIFYDEEYNKFKIQSNYTCHLQGVCYFPSKESAEDALENIVKPFMREHPDFVW